MKNNLEYVECAVCENKSFKSIIKQKELDYDLNLVICKKCSLGLLNPRWTKEAYNVYYKEEYDKQYRSDIESEEEKYLSPNPIIERFKNNDIDISKFKNILDIGCGSGENLVAFKNANPKIECYGIEPSIKSQKKLINKGVNIISDDVDSNWDFDCENKFDIIIMRHVLEHFLTPLEVLKKVYNVLNKNGILYIAVPNNLLEKRYDGWLRLAHTYYFNAYTLSEILKKASFGIQYLHLEDEYNRFEVFSFVKKDLVNIDFLITKKIVKHQEQAFKKSLKNNNMVSSKDSLKKSLGSLFKKK
tara:strand:+ start:880 stop:1782 length:903 start_codon:yes stop_codon:yes gene_type:complete